MNTEMKINFREYMLISIAKLINQKLALCTIYEGYKVKYSKRTTLTVAISWFSVV